MSTNHNTYFTAFYGIEDNTLYAAIEYNKHISPVIPVTPNSNGTYNFLGTLKKQDFVDAVFNDFFVYSEDPSQKISVIMEMDEVMVCSDGRMVFAASPSLDGLCYATEQIYKNLAQFKKPNLVGYRQ